MRVMDETKRNKSIISEGITSNRCQLRREKKVALEQEVDKLKKKLRHEENVHRALERGFSRPLGALPRLPPYLPKDTMQLLAEVAVLEEEVVWLEEQLVNFRNGLYQEAIHISCSKKTDENRSEIVNKPRTIKLSFNDFVKTSSNHSANAKKSKKKLNASSLSSETQKGNCYLSGSNFMEKYKQFSAMKVSKIKSAKESFKLADGLRECKAIDNGKAEKSRSSSFGASISHDDCGPNKISEDILKCLMDIFLRMDDIRRTKEMETYSSVSGFRGISRVTEFQDPFCICREFSRRDIGPYKHFRAIELNYIFPNILRDSSFLSRRLKNLLRKLSLVDLSELKHQQKLAFWINIYNSCMMKAHLEKGIPDTPEMLITLMSQAKVNVGGHLLSAMTIEQFILRLPYNSQIGFPNGTKGDEMTMRSIFGLEWPEPLVTFALSCGTWSSPALRIYTSKQVENELEIAKRQYLQAAVGISMPDKLGIPKMLDWYLHDFAKDIESLMDWICLQLPSEVRTEAVQCLEVARSCPVNRRIKVLPYDFRFRYLLVP